MTSRTSKAATPAEAIRRVALQYPEAEQGTTCNKQSFKARKKAFLFLGRDAISFNVMLKLGESLAEAGKLAAQDPTIYRVGAHGWVSATFPHGQTPPPGLLERWIDESYRLLVPKALVALLPVGGQRKDAPKPPTK
jgi:hypothetical protein